MSKLRPHCRNTRILFAPDLLAHHNFDTWCHELERTLLFLRKGLEKSHAENSNKRRSRWERHAHLKRANPSDERGASLANWTMLILSARLYAHSLYGEQRNYIVLRQFSTPVSRSSCRKSTSPKRFHLLVYVLVIQIIRQRTGRYF